MIGIKTCNDPQSKCEECSALWINTPEMYIVGLCGYRVCLCKDCLDKLFNKSLRANCAYNAKIKSQQDQQRIRNYNKLKEDKYNGQNN